MSTSAAAIEVVRGGLNEERADDVLAFWAARGVLEGDAGRARLPAVVCVAIDEEGEVVGVNSVQEQTAPLVGRPFWIYRSLLANETDDLADAMFNSAFEALAEEFDTDGPGPIGVCLAVEDRRTMEGRPEAGWPDTELFFAGYLPAGRQLRIRYFWQATIDRGDSRSLTAEQMADRDLSADYQAGEKFRIEPLAESSAVSAEDVLALGAREGRGTDEPARRRIDQVSLVAVTVEGELAGISSVY